MVHPLDTITYTLTYSNPSNVAVLNAVLVDNLPPTAQMSYVAGSASNGGVYNPAANSLTWNIPTVPAGAVVHVTYQIQTTFESGTSVSRTLVNKACLNYPSGVVCDSRTVTVTGSYVVHVAVYNQAGELVKTLTTFETGNNISELSITNGVITTDGQTAQLYYKGILLGTWDATNSQGGKVTNGTYLVKVDSTDPYGVTTSITQNISVAITRDTLSVAVYNEAGEIVKHFTQAEVQSLIAGSNGVLSPEDFNVGKIKISSSTISPSYSNTTGPGQTLTVTLGSGRSFTWDGRGDNGNILTSGEYFIEVESAVQGSTKQQIVMPIHVQDNNASSLSDVVLGPNPVKLSQATVANFYFNNLSNDVTGIAVKIYTVAGELTQTLNNTPGNLAMIPWNLSQANLASGTYLAVVELSGNHGLLGRKVVQVVVLH